MCQMHSNKKKKCSQNQKSSTTYVNLWATLQSKAWTDWFFSFCTQVIFACSKEWRKPFTLICHVATANVFSCHRRNVAPLWSSASRSPEVLPFDVNKWEGGGGGGLAQLHRDKIVQGEWETKVENGRWHRVEEEKVTETCSFQSNKNKILIHI